MSDIYFTTNPADFTKLEGLYVAERNPSGFIAGTNLSITGFAGKCVRGPEYPVSITSTGRFLDVFGGRDYTADGTGGARIGEVHGALCNKPFGAMVVRRAVAAAAVKATHSYSDAVPTAIIRVDAFGRGAWGNNLTVAIEDATNANAQHFNVRITYLGDQVLLQNLDCTTGHNNLSLVVGTDDARYIDITKLADGRPVNASAALSAGADGSIASGDYNTAMNELAVFPGVAVCLVPEAVPTASTYHANLVTLAASVSDRVFLTWAQTHGQAVATEITQIGADITTRTDRVWWCYNSAFTVDPDTQAEFEQGPHIAEASILSQIDIDIHPGAFETVKFLAGLTRVANANLQRTDLIALRAAGITTLERTEDGFQFRSCLTSSLQPGKTEQTRRRMTDFLQLSASKRLRYFVKAKGTEENQGTMASELNAFSQELRGAGRVIKDFAIDQVSVNTEEQRAEGLEKLLWRVKLISHMLYIVFETDISTGVTIEQQAA